MEVLAAAATGQTTKEIAAAQGVTANTVKFHLRNVYEKLGVSNRSQAIAIYLSPDAAATYPKRWVFYYTFSRELPVPMHMPSRHRAG
jgi:hypothetical protein